jgi:hypothetical protein
MADYYAWWTMEGVDELDTGWAKNLCDGNLGLCPLIAGKCQDAFWATVEGGAAQSGLAGGCRGVNRLGA